MEKQMFKKLSQASELSSLQEEGDTLLEIPKTQEVRNPKYSPYSWEEYFEQSINIEIPETNDTFHVYYTPPSKKDGTLFVMHHGAGSSALTFGLTAKHIRELTQGECGIMAVDCRGHGATKTAELDYDLDRLSNDFISVIKETVKDDQDILLIGHSLQSGTLRNTESARLSIPPLLEKNEQNKLKWITDLRMTKSYWSNWFTGLSEKFLSLSTAKLLILAGTDRLDKPLIIGQMQGKFQLQIFPEAGHFLQEDAPLKTAQSLIDFWKRNRRLVLPPKAV